MTRIHFLTHCPLALAVEGLEAADTLVLQELAREMHACGFEKEEEEKNVIVLSLI